MYLAAAGTLRAKAGTASVISYTVHTDEVTTTDTFSPVAQGQLANTTTTIYTAPSLTQSLITEIQGNSNSLSNIAITFYINGTAASNLVWTGTVPAGGSFSYNGKGWTIYDSNGVFQSVGSTGPAGTISVGTVTNIGTTGPPTVTNVGTGTAAVLNFGLQQGATGNTGASGVVQAVTAADSSITIGGTTANPTVSRPALTGDVTASAGSNATTLAAGSASNLNSGTLLAARMPALTGDITTSAGAVATTIKTDVALAGNPTTTTQTANNNTTRIATTAYVDTADALKVPTARTISTTAPLTGGGDLSANRTFAITVASNSAAGSQSAIDKAKQDNLSAFQANILDFGGVGNGSFDNTTAINNAIASLASGGIVFFPAGQFNHASALTLSANNIQMRGAGANATTLHFTLTTGDQLTISGYGCGISDMTVQGPGSGTTSSKTAGYGVNLTGTETYVQNLEFNYQFDCLGLNGPLAELDDVLCRYYGRSATVVNQNSDHRINRLFTDNNVATLPTGAGIDVQVTASLLISNCNIIHANWCLNLSPATGVTIPSIKGINNFFDSSAIGLRAAGAGSVFRSEFTNCWFSSMSTAGVLFAPTTAGANVDGVTFVNCDFYNNVAGTTTGFSVTTANVGKWKMIGCSVAGWTTGIGLVAGAAHYPTIEGNTIGAVSAFGVNTTGINVGAGAYGGLVMANNDVNDNTTALTLGAVTITGAVYSKYSITNNPGINPRGAVTTPGVPLTTAVVTNTTGFRVQVIWKVGTANASVTINGVLYTVATVAASVLSVTLEPGGTFSFATGTMTSWIWVGQ